MPENKEWTIEIDSFGGFVPAWFENAYPNFGNKNQASDMKNANIIDPNVLTQGPAATDLTDGTQAGAISTLVRGFTSVPVADNVAYAVGGAKLYQLSATAVTNAGIWPHTIDKGTVTGEDGESVIYYKSALYYFYNHSASAGDIGKYDLATTFDDDWGSTVPTGAGTLQTGPHQAINGGDDIVYFLNGKYVGYINGTTLNLTGLDFWDNAITSSITWNGNRVVVAVNRPNLTGSNYSQSGIYNWDGYSSSWDGDPIEINGRIGALYTKNGVTFVWWQDGTDTGGYSFGYISGVVLKTIKRYKGSLPLWYQVGEYKGFLAWLAGSLLYMWGAKDADLPVSLFQYMSPKQATAGGMGTPFGDLLLASYSGSNFSLAKGSGYAIDTTWKTKAFTVSGVNYKSQIDLIMVETERMSSGAKADFTLTYDKGKSTQTLTQIAYSSSDYTRHKILGAGPQVEDFRIDVSWANGSASNPCKIRRILIQGHYIVDN